MASLPHHYPHLSLHLADRSLIPLISSSSPSSSSSSSSSPASPLRHAALARLASSALGVHDAASRLGLGAPQRVLVEYGPRGPVLIQTFLDPATASAVAPAGGGSGHPRPGAAGSALSSSSPIATALAATAAAAGGGGGGGGGPSAGAAAPDARRGTTTAARRAEGGGGGGVGMVRQAAVNGTPPDDQGQDQDHDDDDECGDDETEAEAETSTSPLDVPPMLLGVILAANPDESSSARRATVRLERIGRQIQESWAADGDQPPS